MDVKKVIEDLNTAVTGVLALRNAADAKGDHRCAMLLDEALDDAQDTIYERSPLKVTFAKIRRKVEKGTPSAATMYQYTYPNLMVHGMNVTTVEIISSYTTLLAGFLREGEDPNIRELFEDVIKAERVFARAYYEYLTNCEHAVVPTCDKETIISFLQRHGLPIPPILGGKEGPWWHSNQAKVLDVMARLGCEESTKLPRPVWKTRLSSNGLGYDLVREEGLPKDDWNPRLSPSGIRPDLEHKEGPDYYDIVRRVYLSPTATMTITEHDDCQDELSD